MALTRKPEVKVTYGKRKDITDLSTLSPLRDNSLFDNGGLLRDVTNIGSYFNKENTLNERIEFDEQMIQSKKRDITDRFSAVELNDECIEIGAQFIRPKRRVTTGSILPAVEFNDSYMGNVKQERKSGIIVKQKSIGDFFKPASVELNSNQRKKKKKYATIPRFNKRIYDENTENNVTSSSPSKKRVKSYEQTYLDIGQKDFGAYTCPECQMSYVRGVLGYQDEITLESIAEANDRVVLLVYNQSHYFERHKIKNTIEWVNLELGAVMLTEEKLNTSKAYFYIANKYDIVGFALAIQIEKAYKVVVNSSNDKVQNESSKDSNMHNETDVGSGIFCCTNPIRAFCGISRLWVKKDYRRKKVASKLLDHVRKNFIYGCEIKPSEVAFSQPSGDGKSFATNYTGTREFLVYSDD
ncbi:19249_t:CDS:2 [Funneliformis geosporum]|uniref:19249_t:CDS:1 n=1 Tax=Funneliformis geosporum TaxID=1117311 RepID=A0A9W4WMG9_9GLOM|nr:19249_t:CDS:2 [Funneliformis geosporum]